MTTEANAGHSARKNREMFNLVAIRYDWLNRVLSFGLDRFWRREVARALSSTHHSKILDIGTGTGDLIAEVENLKQSCQVFGLDPAASMLHLARQKGCGLLVQGDALSLPFPDEIFDGIVSAFCLRNFVSRPGAFSEMKRVLKPTGRLSLVELTKPSHPVMRWGHWLYTRTWLPVMGRLFSSAEAYDYLNRSIQQFPPADAVLAELTAAGFEKPQATMCSGGIATLFYAGSQDI